jgi:CMP-N,N'-diacetyllegionaminic acid synthase
LNLLIENDFDYTSVATYSQAELNPIRAWIFENNKPKKFIEDGNPFLPRQLLPKVYQLNGVVYTLLINSINEESNLFLGENPGGIIIPKERAIDIDDEIDFIVAEKMLKKKLDLSG